MQLMGIASLHPSYRAERSARRKSKSASKRLRRAIGCKPKTLIEKQTRRNIMRFFERLKTAASAEWRAYTEHPFTNGLADGSLAEAAFRHYLVQDYLFLIEFARAYALSVYKSPKLDDMREAAAGLSAILDIEMNLHVKLCAGWGLSPSDPEQTPPAVEMLAYMLIGLGSRRRSAN